MKIVCVDDDPDDREIFRDIIREIDSKIELHIACECEDAIHMVSNAELLPDFIFLDMNMPKIDGFECLRILKSIDRIKSVPVIICTTASTKEQRRKAIELGAHDLILKESSYGKMKDALCRVFRKDYQLIC